MLMIDDDDDESKRVLSISLTSSWQSCNLMMMMMMMYCIQHDIQQPVGQKLFSFSDLRCRGFQWIGPSKGRDLDTHIEFE